MAAIVEIEHATGSLVPELSFGTHFFQDLVETGILYVALFADTHESWLNTQWIAPAGIPSPPVASKRLDEVVKVVDFGTRRLLLMTDVVSQRAICFDPSKIDQ